MADQYLVRQLGLDSRPPRRFAFNLMRQRGFVLLFAASVALLSSLIVPHSLIVLAPAAAVLCTLGIVKAQQQRKEGVLRPPQSNLPCPRSLYFAADTTQQI